MSDVRIKSGEQPRYFAFGNVLSTAAIANSTPVYKESPYSSFQAIVTAAGSATVLIQVTNEDATFVGTNSNWVTMGTITLTSVLLTDGFTTIAPWRYVRASVTAVSGTVQIIMGV